jgi:hypothetical protein
MHDMMKRHEVQVLRRAGVTQEQVAKLTGISVRSVLDVNYVSSLTTTTLPHRLSLAATRSG